MLYSKLFGKTTKTAKEYDSVNATLLIKGGFIDQTAAGVYTFLPLGLRVLTKIENIIREEMNKVASEIFMPSISPKNLWEQTGRYEKIDVLFKVEGANKLSLARNDAIYVLNPTHEEIVTPLAKKFNFSYRDLPFAIYQIQTKFRNEARPKSGLLRGREFRMKDMYSFHENEENFKKFYKEIQKLYMNVYNRVGIGDRTVLSLASGGDFSDDYSHEFQTKCDNGEDTLFYTGSSDKVFNKEIAPSKAPEFYDKKESFKEMKKIETVAIVGVDALAKFLNIPVERTTKTMLYSVDRSRVVAVAVRGDYEINELKLKSILKCKHLELASEEIVEKTTGAKVGYAGTFNLPKEVEVIFDDSIENAVNFECGANETNAHMTNVNFDRDVPRPKKFHDIKMVKEGDMDPENGEIYKTCKASEVGNIFSLGSKFANDFDYCYTDENGKKKEVVMGCYGLGSSRVMGVLAEIFHDEKGLIWPENVAPFQVHIVSISDGDGVVENRALEIHDELEKAGIETLLDDRQNVSAGEKFADADLIGIPYRLVVSKKTGNKVEFKRRGDDKSVKLISIKEAIKLIN